MNEELIQKLYREQEKYNKSIVLDVVMKLGEPASADSVAHLEKEIGFTLPPSYREFLTLHNGWTNFYATTPLYSTRELCGMQTDKRIIDWKESEMKMSGADLSHAFVIGGSSDSDLIIYLDKASKREDGEMEVVLFNFDMDDERYKTFTSFLEHMVTVTERLLRGLDS